MMPGRTVLMQRQGNSMVASWAPAPVHRPNPVKPSLPMPKVRYHSLASLLRRNWSGRGQDIERCTCSTRASVARAACFGFKFAAACHS